MARIRTIKPDFFRHEELFAAEKASGLPLRIAFAGLWTVADREGLFRWKPVQIKLDIFPFDDVDMHEILTALRYYGFIIRYEAEGKDFGFIPSFKEHQVINSREAASRLPSPPPVTVNAVTRHGNAYGEGKGREGKEYTRVTEVLCKVFAKAYKIPTERMPAEANFYNDIDIQADKLLEVHKPDEVIKQVTAYLRYCKAKDRRLIGHAYKLSETILSSNWEALMKPEGPEATPSSPFEEAEYNKKLWTDEAWRKTYAFQIKSSEGFRKHFKL